MSQSEKKADDISPDVGFESETIEQSFRDHIRKHIYWLHEAIETRFAKKHGASAANDRFQDIRLTAMHETVRMGRKELDRVQKAANNHNTDF